jgi:hypothetical protein
MSDFSGGGIEKRTRELNTAARPGSITCGTTDKEFMPEITIKRNEIHAGALGEGALRIQIHVPNPLAPLAPTDADLFHVNVETGGGKSFALGSGQSVKLGFEATTRTRLLALWKQSAAERRRLLKEYDLANYFDANPERVLLVFQSGVSADAEAAARMRHAPLSASATLRAGADAGYVMVRSAPAGTPADQLVREFFAALRLPGDVSAPLANDEVIVFEYGGYLNFRAGVNFGYELSGASSLALSELALTQRYEFSLLAKLTLGAKLLGRFKVVVRAGAKPGWGRVTILKSRSKSFSVGAVVDAAARVETEGWPENANELIASMVGLKAKNWLSLFDRIAEIENFADLEANLDGLARDFIERYTDKAFDALRDHTQFDEFLARVRRVTSAYRNLGADAVTLFDRFYDPIANVVDDRLGAALDRIQNATSWETMKLQIRVDTGDILWSVIQQLTDGNALAWIAGEAELAPGEGDSLEALRRRARNVMDLIADAAHDEIRGLIALAKSQFPLDRFLVQLDGVSTLAKLNAKADKQLAAFVERIIGQALAPLSTPEADRAIARFHNTLAAIQKFRDTAFDKITDALNQSFQFSLQAEYSRATEDQALFDFEFDLRTEGGRALMREAGHGNFENVLAAFDREFVVIRKGAILARTMRESRVSINLLGWARKWRYEGLDRLITQAEQRIQSDGNGQLTAITDVELKSERERKRQGERVYTNLLLRFVGESHGKLDFDPANRMYLIDAIKRSSARYKLVLDDPATRPDELMRYLVFASEFGLADSGQEAFERMKELLPTDANGNFGRVSLAYDVRFTEKSLQALVHEGFYAGGKFKPEIEAALRRTMRLIVLLNYTQLRDVGFPEIGWAYWTPGVHAKWREQGENFIPKLSSRELSPIALSPAGHLKAPNKVLLRPFDFRILDSLYKTENSLLNGMARLSSVLRETPGKLSPKAFEEALADFGRALTLFDDLDRGDNTLFALFDRLIRMAGGEGRNSSLTLTATLDGREVTETLIT